MNPAPVQSAHRSGLVTFIAWMGIISGALGVLGTAVGVLTQPATITVVIFLSALSTLATGLGLRARREWARRGFIAVLAYSAIMAFVGVLHFRFPDLSQFPSQPGTAGSPPPVTQEQLDAMAAQLRPMLLASACVSALVSLLLIAKLSTRRVREEFDAESAA